MRILHFISSFTTGGTENMLIEEMEFFSKKHELHLVILCNNVDEALISKIPSQVSVHKIDRSLRSINPFYIFKCINLIRDISPDIIVYQSITGHKGLKRIYDIQSFSFLLPYPKILRVHSSGCFAEKAYKSSITNYDIAVCISESSRQILPQHLEKKAVIIHNGINLKKIISKTKWNIGNKIKIVQVGRLDHLTKGQDILLESVSKLKKTFNIKKIEIDFIGEGPSRQYLMGMTSDLGLDKHVRFLGNCDKEYINKNLSSYDIGVLCSRHEGFGNVIIEYMAAGLPVLSSKIEGPTEILKNGEFGWMFESNNPTDCSSKILSILKDYGSISFVEKIKMTKKRSNDFTIEKMCSALDSIYSTFEC